MSKHKLPLEKSKWFIFNKETKEYVPYGFPTKQTAFTEATKLNAEAEELIFAVSPAYNPPPVLKLIKGGKE